MPMSFPDTVSLQLVSEAGMAFWAGASLAEMGLLDYATSDLFYLRLDMFPLAKVSVPKLKMRTAIPHFMTK